tara:strand:- start:992 stop:1321 length:330 start_codon:yes stop_codon:yes gene_type:complete
LGEVLQSIDPISRLGSVLYIRQGRGSCDALLNGRDDDELDEVVNAFAQDADGKVAAEVAVAHFKRLGDLIRVELARERCVMNARDALGAENDFRFARRRDETVHAGSAA